MRAHPEGPESCQLLAGAQRLLMLLVLGTFKWSQALGTFKWSQALGKGTAQPGGAKGLLLLRFIIQLGPKTGGGLRTISILRCEELAQAGDSL